MPTRHRATSTSPPPCAALETGLFSVFHVISEQVSHRHSSWMHILLPLAFWVLDYYQVRAAAMTRPDMRCPALR